MRKLICTTIFFAGFQCFAQLGGERIYQFLNLPMTAKQNALGGINVTIIDDNPTQVMYNPASLNPEMDNVLSLNYGNHFGGINMGSAAYAKELKPGRLLQIGVTYLNYGDIKGYDEMGVATGNFSGNDVAVSLGYSYQIQESDFYVGTNLKVISSAIEQYSSLGVAADISGTYANADNGWVAALTVRNVGMQVKAFDEVKEKLPMQINLGLSKQLENVPIRWHFTLENLQKWNIAFANPNRTEVGLDGTVKEEKVGFVKNALNHMIIGTELFTNKKFNIRLGYNFRRGEEMRILEQRSFSGFSGGFGLKLRRFNIDYSHARVTLAGNTNMVGVSVKL